MVIFNIDKNYVFDELKSFLNDDSVFKEETLELLRKDYPDLLEEYKANPSDELINKYIPTVINSSVYEYKEKLESYWKRYEKEIFNALENITQTKINFDINCYLRDLHWYPRDLTKKEFALCSKDSLFNSMSTMIHEITHFYYFKKWAEVFPNCPTEYYEAPHPYWHLSELMAYVIDNDIRVRGISFTTWIQSEYAYQSLNNSGEISMQGFFDKLYNENITNFEKFLIEAKNTVDKNKNLFN